MKNKKFISIILAVLFFAPNVWGQIAGKAKPYQSKEALLMAFYEAGFKTIFEFKTGYDGFKIHLPGEGVQGRVLTTSITNYDQKVDELIRVPRLDYEVGSQLLKKVSFGRVGGKTYEAYKLSDFAICYAVNGEHFTSGLNASGWEFCLAVPIPIDVVINQIEKSEDQRNLNR